MDMSEKTLGVFLGHKEYKTPFLIYFSRKKLSRVEMNYSINKKLFLAILYAINKLRYYFTGYPIFLHTDHASIK
jgi:hypothetical protein